MRCILMETCPQLLHFLYLHVQICRDIKPSCAHCTNPACSQCDTWSMNLNLQQLTTQWQQHMFAKAESDVTLWQSSSITAWSHASSFVGRWNHSDNVSMLTVSEIKVSECLKSSWKWWDRHQWAIAIRMQSFKGSRRACKWDMAEQKIWSLNKSLAALFKAPYSAESTFNVF